LGEKLAGGNVLPREIITAGSLHWGSTVSVGDTGSIFNIPQDTDITGLKEST